MEENPPKLTILPNRLPIEPGDSFGPRSFQTGRGRTARLIAIITAITAGVATIGGIVVPPIVAYINRPPPPKSNLEEVIKTLAEESRRQDKEIRQMHEDMTEMRGWLAGYIRATGARVRDPEDSSIPAPDPFKVIERSTSRRKKTELAEVQTPLPSPRPLTKPAEIPAAVIPKPE